MRSDYVDAIIELQAQHPARVPGVATGQVLAGAELEEPDREIVGKIPELAAVSRARRRAPRQDNARTNLGSGGAGACYSLRSPLRPA